MAATTLDAVRPLGLEVPSEGGTETRTVPTAITSTADAVEAAGLIVVGPTVTTADKTVYVDRASAGTLRFTDQNVSRVLPELVSATTGQTTSHNSLRDMAHLFGDQGPDVGFGNTTCALSYSGLLLTSSVWYTSPAMTTKIFSKTLSYASGSLLPATIVYVLYSSAGTAIRTCTDTLSYTGLCLTGISRVWS